MVVGIEEAINVYEVCGIPSKSWSRLANNYQLALEDFEAQRFADAARRIGKLIQLHPDDRPCRKLLARTVKELDEPTERFSATWVLGAK